MGRHQTKTCDVCFKSMRGDVLKRHMKKLLMVNFNFWLLYLPSTAFPFLFTTCNMGRHQTKIYNVCFKTMRSDNLKRYMKNHHGKTEDNIVTKGVDDGKIEDNVTTLSSVFHNATL